MKLVTTQQTIEELRSKLRSDIENPVGFDTESSGPSLEGLSGKRSRLRVKAHAQRRL